MRGFSDLTVGKERGNEKNRAASLRGKISSHSQLRVSISSQRRASEARLFSLPLPLVHAVPLSLLREGDPATMPTGADFGVTLVRFSFVVLFLFRCFDRRTAHADFEHGIFLVAPLLANPRRRQMAREIRRTPAGLKKGPPRSSLMKKNGSA